MSQPNQQTVYSLVINSAPGIQRDGTPYASNAYIDAQWTRFYNHLPKKMGGYRRIGEGSTEFVTNMIGFSAITTQVKAFLGRASSFNISTYKTDGVEVPEITITPSTIGPYPFVPNANNTWSITTFTQAVANECGAVGAAGIPIPQKDITYVIGTAIPNAQNISSDTECQIFFGKTDGSDSMYPLTATDHADACSQTAITTSGFICAVGRYLFTGGDQGLVAYCSAGDLTTWPIENIQYLTGATKLIQAKPTSSTSQPSILVWSLDTLWQGVLSPTDANPDNFVFTPKGNDITIISPYSVVAVDSVFYWIGARKHYVYTGAVQEIENTRNKDYFFDNINWDYSGRIWGIYLPLYNEIVYFYPRGDSTVCNASILYNPATNEFYDNRWGRSAGIYVSGFPYPILADSEPTFTQTSLGLATSYPIWQHEYGTDKIVNGISYAIESYYKTHYFAIRKDSPEIDQQISTFRFEPDYKSKNENNVTGQMTLELDCTAYPNSTSTISDLYAFDSTMPFVSLSNMGRSISFKVSNNVVGGDFYAGLPTVKYTLGDVTPGS